MSFKFKGAVVFGSGSLSRCGSLITIFIFALAPSTVASNGSSVVIVTLSLVVEPSLSLTNSAKFICSSVEDTSGTVPALSK